MKPQMNTDKYGSASVCVHLWFRMLRPVGFRLLCFELLFFGLLTQHAGSGAYQGEDGEVRKLAEGVYVRIAAADQSIVSNAGFVELDNSVLVFDTHFTLEAGQSLLAAIQKITTKPVRYLVNSHFHPDHTHGNQSFAGPVHIIATTNARRDVVQRDLPAMNRTLGIAQAQIEKMKKDLIATKDPAQQAGLRAQIQQHQKFLDRMTGLKILPPVLGVEDSLDVNDTVRPARLLYLGKGHTDGDLVLYLPNEKIAFVGDLFFNSALPNTQDAFLLEWMRTLAELLKLDAETFVPGHGPVGTKSAVKDFLKYLEELKEWVEPRVTEGAAMEQVLRDVKLPPKYSSYSYQYFFPANLQKMYSELRAAK